MNVYHTGISPYCKNLAPCGKLSLSKCHRYKGRLEECKGCTLIRRKMKTKQPSEDEDRRVCPKCGKELPLFRFYRRTVRNGDKEYLCYTSWCKMCSSEYVKNRYKEKKNK